MIEYKIRRKFKYNLHADVEYSTNMEIDSSKDLGYLAIDTAGNLSIRKGYSWDGPSGPTIDTKNFMRGSLIHDALYQLMREGVLRQDVRDEADQIFRETCIQDGMSKLRAWSVYQAVKIWGAGAAKPDLLHAP